MDLNECMYINNVMIQCRWFPVLCKSVVCLVCVVEQVCVFLHGVTVSKHDTHISMMVSLLFKSLHVITVCLLSEQRLCQDERSSATRFPGFSGGAG